MSTGRMSRHLRFGQFRDKVHEGNDIWFAPGVAAA
jgi:hypothetical protein